MKTTLKENAAASLGKAVLYFCNNQLSLWNIFKGIEVLVQLVDGINLKACIQ